MHAGSEGLVSVFVLFEENLHVPSFIHLLLFLEGWRALCEYLGCEINSLVDHHSMLCKRKKREGRERERKIRSETKENREVLLEQLDSILPQKRWCSRIALM